MLLDPMGEKAETPKAPERRPQAAIDSGSKAQAPNSTDPDMWKDRHEDHDVSEPFAASSEKRPKALLGRLANIGWALIAIPTLLLVLAIGATCQFAQGQIRPYLPPIVRDLVTNPENKAVIDDYVNGVDGALDGLLKDADECKVNRDQPCLTAAFERAYRAVGDGVPVEASWMSGAHGRLHEALKAMVNIHRRSETEPVTGALLGDSLAATDEFVDAVDEWYREADR